MFRAIKNTLVFRKKEKVTISPQQLLSMLKWVKVLGNVKYSIRLALLLGYLGLFRISSYAVTSDKVFDCKVDTTVSDCDVSSGSLVVSLKKTKTQHNGDPIVVVVPEIKSKILSAVYNFNKMLEVVNVRNRDSTPVIVIPGRIILTSILFNAILKVIADHVCNLKENVASHVLRRSGTTYLHKAGASPVQLAKAGTWKSEVYLSYVLSQANENSLVQNAANNMFS